MNLFAKSPFASIETSVLWLLVIFSVITWTLAVIKAVRFIRQRKDDCEFKQQFWQSTNLPQAAEFARGQSGAAAQVAQAGFAAIGVDESASGSLAEAIDHRDRLERALRQQVQKERRALEKGLAVLASIGSTSPFIGLFGTVWGIMDALKGISKAGNASLETVAGPIGSALIATGIGIAVAVPAVLIYNYFVRCLKVTTAELGDFSHDFYSLAQKNNFRLVVRSAGKANH